MKKVVLCILDGWGISDATADNAIARATTPCWDALWQHDSLLRTSLEASEHHVGLPKHQMGNSEVGHMSIGAGRLILQDLPRIHQSLADGTIFNTPQWQNFTEKSRSGTKTVHLCGLLSPGGIHSHQEHIIALAQRLAEDGFTVWIHAISDGRDTPPKDFLEEFNKTISQQLASYPRIQFATLSGRYYAMDRDHRWERTQKAYETMHPRTTIRNDDNDSVEFTPSHFPDIQSAVAAAYAEGVSDEFIKPCVLGGFVGILPGDALLLANFRADRMRQLSQALVSSDFTAFPRQSLPAFSAALSMCEYAHTLTPDMPILFPKQDIYHTLGDVIAHNGLKQLRIAETEKYAHVTFFFNGGREEILSGEERILIPSPQVATYDQQPEMSASHLTDVLIEQLSHQSFNFVLVNYANADMVGHTGDTEATKRAITHVDTCLARLRHACERLGYILVVTADHGNAECMYDSEKQAPHTAHTLNRVPFIIDGMRENMTLKSTGSLIDIAPTLLHMMGLEIPKEMSGRCLIS